MSTPSIERNNWKWWWSIVFKHYPNKGLSEADQIRYKTYEDKFFNEKFTSIR